MKNKFGFILVKPQLGENIGACARSMKNFGFNKLHIVSPKILFPNQKAKATSVGAFDIINKTKVFNEELPLYSITCIRYSIILHGVVSLFMFTNDRIFPSNNSGVDRSGSKSWG